MDDVNVICVKWGQKYSEAYVNALYDSIGPYCNNFYCYTDYYNPSLLNPNIKVIKIPSSPTLNVWWNKLPLFSNEFPIQGKFLYLDLDVQINSNPFPYLKDLDWSSLTLIDCPWKNDKIYDRATNYDVRIHSSVMTWESSDEINEIWDYFINSGFKDYFLRKYVGIDRYIVHEEFNYKTFPHEFVQSKKYEPDKIAPITTFEEYDDKRSVLSKSS